MFLLVVKGFVFIFLLWFFITQILNPALNKTTMCPMFRRKRAKMEADLAELNAELEDIRMEQVLEKKKEEVESVRSGKSGVK